MSNSILHSWPSAQKLHILRMKTISHVAYYTHMALRHIVSIRQHFLPTMSIWRILQVYSAPFSPFSPSMSLDLDLSLAYISFGKSTSRPSCRFRRKECPYILFKRILKLQVRRSKLGQSEERWYSSRQRTSRRRLVWCYNVQGWVMELTRVFHSLQSLLQSWSLTTC